MLHVQETLRAGATLEALQQPPYSLIVKRHAEFPNLVLLKYNQIESNMASPLVCQCRGLILDETDNWECVSRPFDKFWNAHEGRAATIDWTTARAQEKLDGSLIQMYWYRGLWRVGTSGTPDASGQVNGSDLTFQGLFWLAWNQMEFTLPGDGTQGITFLFELTSPYNRVVTRQTSHRLRLIGARETASGHEYAVRNWLTYWPVQEFPLDSFENVVATFDSFDPLAQEGYVIVDAAFNRIKMKHPGYVALHHLRDNLTPKRIVEVVRRGETSEVLASFPEWTEEFTRVEIAFSALVGRITLKWDQWKHTVIQKEFALAVKDEPWSGVLFALRKGTVATIREALRDVRVESLTQWLQLREGA